MSSDTGPLLAGQLARLAGVSTDTLRHYERKGLLAAAPRRANGYRAYPRAALQRVHVIRRALAMGFTIRELSEILSARARGVPPCERVRALAAAKLAALDEHLAEMTRLARDAGANPRGMGHAHRRHAARTMRRAPGFACRRRTP